MIEEKTQLPAEIPTSNGLAGGPFRHTPGPWELGDISGGHVQINSFQGGHRWNGLANVVWKMAAEEVSPDCQANAHLIAAAPELLQVCRVAHLMLCERFLDGPAAKDVAGTLERAIGKALGITRDEPANNPTEERL